MNSVSTSPCFICKGDRFHTLFTKGKQEYVRCAGCGVVVVDPLPASVDLRAFYDRDYKENTGGGWALAAQEQMARATARYRLNVVRAHAHGTRWLDVGCSTGLLLDEVNMAGFEAEGIDISSEAVEEARSRNLKAYAVTVEGFSAKEPYDIVTGFDVIEHVLDPVVFLHTVRRLLRPGGVLALTTPDTGSLICQLMGRRWYFYIPIVHTYHFNRANLARLLTQTGFQVVHIARACKALNYNYSLIQFQASNSLIYRMWQLLGLLVPRSYRQRNVRLPIGEMLVLAQRAERTAAEKLD
jgi:2-polyprenyl-3-methyl-5-hydroxy-6-metoxy-1,4-benzoquinol methylase